MESRGGCFYSADFYHAVGIWSLASGIILRPGSAVSRYSGAQMIARISSAARESGYRPTAIAAGPPPLRRIGREASWSLPGHCDFLRHSPSLVAHGPCEVDPIVKTRKTLFLERLAESQFPPAGEGRGAAQSSAARRSGAAALTRRDAMTFPHGRAFGPATTSAPRYTYHGV